MSHLLFVPLASSASHGIACGMDALATSSSSVPWHVSPGMRLSIILPADCCLGCIRHIVYSTSSFLCIGTSWDRRLALCFPHMSCLDVLLGVLICKVTDEGRPHCLLDLREETSLIPCFTKESPLSLFEGAARNKDHGHLVRALSARFAIDGMNVRRSALFVYSTSSTHRIHVVLSDIIYRQ
jgi:hypothetical protein